jgi:hypothetical protein
MSDSALSVAANAVSANVYAGKIAEIPMRPSIVRVRLAASAGGLNCTLLIGGRAIVNDQAVNSSNRWPILPDDLLTENACPAGARLVLTFRNTTAGALTVNHVTEVIPVA